jgi:histidyl-tRNA synthetase
VSGSAPETPRGTALRAPKGTYDVLPPDSARWLAVRDALLAPARKAGFGYLESPVFEDVELFARGVGASTDIVAKEMFVFSDRGGRSLALRPEGTAGVIRAMLQARLHTGPLPVKAWYTGPMFRAERPQAGRFRQFQQVGVEAVGVDDPGLDAEVVALAVQGYREVGLTGVRLLLTSLGDAACRPAYRERLQGFLAGLDLDDDTRRRAEINPLRVLDDKRPEVQRQLEGAPLPPYSLCGACAAHHDAVREALADLGVLWEDAPRLVRGLDYYTRTTFELVHDGLGAQSAVGGGGRYDGLAAELGGPELPGIGWALGVERTLLAADAEGVAPPTRAPLDVVVVPIGGTRSEPKRVGMRTADALRLAGVRATSVFGDRGLKGAMKAADRSGARFALVLGERDLADGVAQLKDMTTGEQRALPLDDLVTSVTRVVSETRPEPVEELRP